MDQFTLFCVYLLQRLFYMILKTSSISFAKIGIRIRQDYFHNSFRCGVILIARKIIYACTQSHISIGYYRHEQQNFIYHKRTQWTGGCRIKKNAFLPTYLPTHSLTYLPTCLSTYLPTYLPTSVYLLLYSPSLDLGCFFTFMICLHSR
jgi:hypothetical protein